MHTLSSLMRKFVGYAKDVGMSIQHSLTFEKKREKTRFPYAFEFLLLPIISSTKYINSYYVSRLTSLENAFTFVTILPLQFFNSVCNFFHTWFLLTVYYVTSLSWQEIAVHWNIEISIFVSSLISVWSIWSMAVSGSVIGYRHIVICHRSCEIPLLQKKCGYRLRRIGPRLKRMFKGECWTWEKVTVLVRRQVDKGPADGKVTLADLNES